MTDLSADMRKTGRATFWLCLLIASGLFLVAAANAHLVYVASSSQPACVAHLRQGEGSKGLGLFSAAQSSCSPLRAPGAQYPEGSKP
jgi:hypothetical protein